MKKIIIIIAFLLFSLSIFVCENTEKENKIDEKNKNNLEDIEETITEKEEEKTTVLDNKDDLIKAITLKELICTTPGYGMSEPSFKSDGMLTISPYDCTGLRFFEGKWEIKNDELILIIYGLAGIKLSEEVEEDEEESKKLKPHERNENLVWVEKYDDPINEKIKLKDIKNKIIYKEEYGDTVKEIIELGDYINSKIIDWPLEKYYNIDDY